VETSEMPCEEPKAICEDWGRYLGNR